MHGLGPTRTRVLSLLQSNSGPLTVGAVADELALHKNSARFHLDALVDAGYAERSTEPSGRTGRPPLLYAATSDSPIVSNEHLLELTTVLLSEFVGTDYEAAGRAKKAGHRWGSRVRAEAPQSVAALTDAWGRRGFGVQESGDALLFSRCPFRDSIDPDQLPLVCAIHQGFLEATVEGTHISVGPLNVGPRTCRAALFVS